MTNKKQIDGEKLAKFVKETPEEVLEKLLVKAMRASSYELCMETLKLGDGGLKLTGKCKKCYDYLAEQFILNYIDGKSMFDVIDDTRSDGKFYNTWKGFLCAVSDIVDGGKFQSSRKWRLEDILNNSGISRKTWIKFFDCYFS